MTVGADIIVFGAGSFAARILFDIAATAAVPVTVAIAGRNADRLDWLRTAANARAAIFERPAFFRVETVDLSLPGAAEAAIAGLRPKLVVQAASPQASSVISRQSDGWSRLVAEGGLSATAVFQALFSARVARALARMQPHCPFINCCFADVVNALLASAGLPVTCGVGNIAILASAFAGELGVRQAGRVKVLAHYQTIAPWRRPAAARSGPTARSGPAARVWLEDEEVADIYATFRKVRLTPEPVIDISGASGVPLMLALVERADWRGHAPGPSGLPGGYPVVLRDGVLELDLPAGLGRDEAIRWNRRFEEKSGLVVEAQGKARYTGVLYERLRAESPALAEGFEMKDLEEVYREMAALRARLEARPAR